MRIVLLLSDSASNRYLVNKLTDSFDLVGIVIQKDVSESIGQKIERIGGFKDIVRHMMLRIKMHGAFCEGRVLENKYFYKNNEPRALPRNIPVIRTHDINSPNVRSFIANLKPDLVAVSGTQLLREPILSLATSIKYGIVNMHTGLSPYIRGGNASFWALYSNRPQHIGATIHYVDRDIDKGDIILSAKLGNIEESDTDITLDVKVRYLGVALYLKAIKLIEEGMQKRVKQWPEGKLFAIKTGCRKTLRSIYELHQRLKKDKIIKQYLDNKQNIDKEVIIIE
jgi:methionyl-tRNA formyltransferase